MRTSQVVLAVAFVLALSLAALAPPAAAGFDTFPVCKDKDVRAGGVWLHVGVDCYPGVWVEVCAAGGCHRWDVRDLLS